MDDKPIPPADVIIESRAMSCTKTAMLTIREEINKNKNKKLWKKIEKRKQIKTNILISIYIHMYS